MSRSVSVHPPAASPRPRFVRRWHFLLAAVLFAGGLAYGSWLPFRFVAVSVGEAQGQFAEVLREEVSWNSRSPDVAINVLITVPFAFSCMGALLLGARRFLWAIPAVALTLAVCLALSVAVEFGQLWISGRVASLRDIAAQLVGASAGCVLWILAGPPLARRLDEFLRTREPGDRFVWLLNAYVVGLAVWSLLPFDVVSSPMQIVRKFQRGQIEIVPFTFQFRTVEKMWYGLLVHAAMFIPVGVWAARAFLLRATGVRGFGAAIVVSFGYTLSVELAQLMIDSRYSTSTDVLCGTFGAALGVAGALYFTGERRRNAGRSTGAGLWAALALAWAALTAFVFWLPLTINDDPAFLRGRLKQFVDVPFRLMQRGSDVGAMFNSIRNFGWFVPLGALCAAAVMKGAKTEVGRVYASIAAMLFCLAVGLVIETGQIAIPGRTPDLTEVLIRTAGSAAGLVLTLVVLRRWTP